jgi:hypothetical protein
MVGKHRLENEITKGPGSHGGEPQYRIMSMVGGHERYVLENRIVPIEEEPRRTVLPDYNRPQSASA